ncbi:MAG: ABC transporter substrate-binding protein [Deinococcales bacterium]
MKKAALALTLLGAGALVAATAQSSKPIVVGSVGQPVSLASGKISDGNSIFVQQQIYDRLLDFKPGSTDVIPALATSARPNKNATSWTFTLRTGVKFHDGTVFDANAVKANFDFWWDDTRKEFFKSGNSIVLDIFEGYKSGKSLIKNVVVESAYRVRVDMNSPFANLDEVFATGYFGIVSPAALKKFGEDKYGSAATLAVGTGPFIVKSWQTGDRILLEANKNYWKKGFPKAPGMIVRFISDAAARVAELRAGNIDMIPTGALPYDVLPTLKSDKNVAPVFRPGFNVGYLALNQVAEFGGAKNPLANQKVRLAVASAINKKALVESFYGEYGTTNAYLPPLVMNWSYPKNQRDYVYNPEAAKKLLADAGYPNGFSMELWYMPVSRPYFPNAKPVAETMAKDLSTVGIKVELKSKDWGAYLDDVDAGKFQSYMLGWTGDYNDPDNFYTPLVGPGTSKETGYNNPKFFALLDDARKATSKAKKGEIYGQVADILFEDIVKMPIVHSRPLLARRASLDGWVPGPLGSEPLIEVTSK